MNEENYLCFKGLCPKDGSDIDLAKCVRCPDNINIIETEEAGNFVICQIVAKVIEEGIASSLKAGFTREEAIKNILEAIETSTDF